MELTDIAKQLKETFNSFEPTSNLRGELELFKATYGAAEAIRLGEMNYIVINGEYKPQEDEDLAGGSISPLFFNSINNEYAIIDAKTSSTLIDEVYSRVVYMQRVYEANGIPATKDIKDKIGELIGDEIKGSINVAIDKDNVKDNKANIFQCQLIKDTGVSAAPDVYTFMLKNGEIKEIPDEVLNEVRHLGEVKLLGERDVLESNKNKIQETIFEKYINSDLDIQNINVRSIFELIMPLCDVNLSYTDTHGNSSIFKTSYLASTQDLDALNKNIQSCNTCKHDLVDLDDASKVYKIHINIDAVAEEIGNDGIIYQTGCEDCLIQCEKCGCWHFNYEKFLGSTLYNKVKFAKGRSFIKDLRVLGDINYCSCRQGIEWVYNETAAFGEEGEYNVIPMEKMVLINYAGESLASYEDYKKMHASKLKELQEATGVKAIKLARKLLSEFKSNTAKKYDISLSDIRIASIDKCERCSVCGCGFFKAQADTDISVSFRCDVCKEMDANHMSMLTRSDGIVFMRNRIGKKHMVNKYVLTKLGNLKKISSVEIGTVEQEEDALKTDEQNDAFDSAIGEEMM